MQDVEAYYHNPGRTLYDNVTEAFNTRPRFGQCFSQLYCVSKNWMSRFSVVNEGKNLGFHSFCFGVSFWGQKRVREDSVFAPS